LAQIRRLRTGSGNDHGRLMMAKLIYSAISSLDGYVADSEGNFDWSMPSDEVHRFVNDLERSIGTYLLGRRMYEVMRYWETASTGNGEPSAEQEFAKLWQAADKIIYSRSLEQVSTTRTRLEREFEPGAIQQMKADASRDIAVSGPTLAGQALKLDLVDECHLFLSPIVVGGGTPALPDNVRIELELLDERRFGNGVVYLHYRVTG
jgi:dihydrofolate reductase